MATGGDDGGGRVDEAPLSRHELKFLYIDLQYKVRNEWMVENGYMGRCLFMKNGMVWYGMVWCQRLRRFPWRWSFG